MFLSLYNSVQLKYRFLFGSMYLLLEVNTYLSSFFLRYRFLLDDQLFNFLIRRRVCLSDLGQIFIPLKLMLILTCISVGLKIWPERFTYGLAVNGKEYTIDNLVLVILEAFQCSQVNGEKKPLQPFQISPFSSSKKTGGPLSASNRKKWESTRGKAWEVKHKANADVQKKKVSFHPARIQSNSDLAPFEGYYQTTPFLPLSICSIWQKVWKMHRIQLFQLNGKQINVWEPSLWGT